MASFSDSDHLSSEEDDREELDALMSWQPDVDVVGLGFFTDPIPWSIKTMEKPPPFLGRMCFLVFTLSPASNGSRKSKFAWVFSSILATNVASNGQETEFYAEDTFDTEAHEPLEVEVTLGQKRWLLEGPSSQDFVSS